MPDKTRSGPMELAFALRAGCPPDYWALSHHDHQARIAAAHKQTEFFAPSRLPVNPKREQAGLAEEATK